LLLIERQEFVLICVTKWKAPITEVVATITKNIGYSLKDQ